MMQARGMFLFAYFVLTFGQQEFSCVRISAQNTEAQCPHRIRYCCTAVRRRRPLGSLPSVLLGGVAGPRRPVYYLYQVLYIAGAPHLCDQR